MATKQIDINAAPVTKGHGTATDHVLVWSALRYPFTLTMPVERMNNRAEAGVRHHTEVFTIKPGPNKVPSALWAYNKSKRAVIVRLDGGLLVESNTTSAPRSIARDLTAIERGEPASKSMSIEELCPKARDVSVKESINKVGPMRGLADMDDPNGSVYISV